jgi:hypothetical protein
MLYFDSRDPYLDALGVRSILMAMDERKRRKLLKRVKDKSAVARVSHYPRVGEVWL